MVVTNAERFYVLFSTVSAFLGALELGFSIPSSTGQRQGFLLVLVKGVKKPKV